LQATEQYVARRLGSGAAHIGQAPIVTPLAVEA